MSRHLRSIALLIFALAAPAIPARAQYFYPGGYGGYGWGGWGGGTVQGSIASGMGMYAAGAGVYNLNTAQADAINANTIMNWNEYLWESQQLANQRYRQKQLEDLKTNVDARKKIYARQRNNPSQSDVYSGTALNIALDELTNPKLYLPALRGSSMKIKGDLVRSIPYNYASAAITTSMDDLTQGGPPPSLQTEDFAEDLATLKKLGQQVRKEDDENGRPSRETIQKAREILNGMKAKVAAKYERNTRERNEADRYIKSMLGLATMLEGPAVKVLLADLDKRPDTTMGDLIAFMKAFNLRFGVANTPDQRMVYDQLFPLLDRLRDEASPGEEGLAADITPSKDRQSKAGQFFSGMDYEHFDSKTVHKQNTPQAPAPQP